jgi:hypothetical protein
MNGGKPLKTIWNELEAEFPTIFNNCSVQLLENAATAQVGHHQGMISSFFLGID